VVSAVGHEVDFTIADFAADLRAPTPSAAAELLVPDADAILRTLQREQAQLGQLLRRRLQAAAQRVDHAYTRLRAQHPRNRLRVGGERLAQLHARLQAQHPQIRLALRRERMGSLQQRLVATTSAQLEARRQHLSELARTLNAVSPLATLQRGYAIVLERENDHVVRTAEQARAIERLRVRFADGELPLRHDD